MKLNQVLNSICVFSIGALFLTPSSAVARCTYRRGSTSETMEPTTTSEVPVARCTIRKTSESTTLEPTTTTEVAVAKCTIRKTSESTRLEPTTTTEVAVARCTIRKTSESTTLEPTATTEVAVARCTIRRTSESTTMELTTTSEVQPTATQLPTEEYNSKETKTTKISEDTAKPTEENTPPQYSTPEEPPEVEGWGQLCLTEHNLRRSESQSLDGKSIPALKWDKNLENSAQKWANVLAERNSGLTHSTLGPGENLYATTAEGSSCKPAVDAWFEEYIYYYNQPIGEGDFHLYGHLTQLLWPKTTKLGCAYADGPQWRYVVCHYDPRGNYLGEKLNVRVVNKSRY